MHPLGQDPQQRRLKKMTRCGNEHTGRPFFRDHNRHHTTRSPGCKADPSLYVCTPGKLAQFNFALAMRDTSRSNVQKTVVVLGTTQALLLPATVTSTTSVCSCCAVLSSVVHRRWLCSTGLYLRIDKITYEYIGSNQHPICITRKLCIRECGEEL